MDLKKIRSDFPSLVEVFGKTPAIYFDNTSLTLTPKPVIDSMAEYYSQPGNMRSAHEFSVKTMIKCNESRSKISKLINASSQNEIIWTKNATEGINLISKCLKFNAGDIVLTTDKEHNSNLIPWHNLHAHGLHGVVGVNEVHGVRHEIVRSDRDNTFNLGTFEKMLSKNVKLVSMCLNSIIDGVTLPAKEIIKLSHEYGALVLLDAVLTVPHRSLDVRALDVDFLVFSLSNMCGPNGLGVLYGKSNLLEELNPFLGGGGANTNINYMSSEFQPPPAKFEAGSPNCASIIAAGVTVDYLNSIGFDNIQEHEYKLNKMVTDELGELEDIILLGPNDPKLRGGMFNFNIKGMNPHDIAISIEELGNILVRSGNLCAHSWFEEHMKHGAVSILFYIYNTEEEVSFFVELLKKLIKDLR